MKTKVVASRKWHEPQIETFINRIEVGARIDLDDFIEAVVQEIGNPTMLVSKAALKDKLANAAAVVVAEMKDKTRHIV